MGTIAGPVTWEIRPFVELERHLASNEPRRCCPSWLVVRWKQISAKLWSHERWFTRGWLLLMNKVSVLRFRDHLFSSVLFRLLSYLTFMRLSSSTRSSDGAGWSSTVKGQGPVLCLDSRPFIPLIFLLKKSYFSLPKSGCEYASHKKLSHHQDTLNLKQRNRKSKK